VIVIEIAPNPNCEAVEMRVFHDLEPPRPVTQVRLERKPDHAMWHAVTGWTVSGTPCPARIQKIDDSGEGVAFLVYGGDAGLRFKSARHLVPWRLDDTAQWGEPFLLVSDLSDVRFAQLADSQRMIARSAVHG